jgi:hypothetical protein
VRLAWHIAKKDLRRMALPVGVWLALILVPTIAFCVVSPAVEGNATSSIDTWSRVSWIWVRLLEGVQVFLAYLLAGTLVLEDPLVGTTSFWTTRPIGNARLLGAKIIAAFLLFVVAPIVLLTPVWLASGFALNDLVHAAESLTERFGITLLLALMTASLARNLAQFLSFSILIVGLFFITGRIALPYWRATPALVFASHEWIVAAAMLPAIALITMHQFLSRRAARTWVIMACVLVGGIIIHLAWPWDISGAFSNQRAGSPRPDDHASEIVAAPSFTKHSPRSVPSVYGKTTWRPEGFSVPVYARYPDGTFAMRAGGGWEGEAGLRTLGFKSATAPLIWQVHQLGWRPTKAEERHFKGTLEAWAVRTRVLGEMPARLGAEFRHGVTRVRIVRVVSRGEQMLNLYLEERESEANTAGRWNRNWSLREGGDERYVDCYFLVSRAAKQAQAGTSGELGTFTMNSLVIRFLDVDVNWPQARGEATLVKMRFERDHAFELPLEVNGVSSEGMRQIP